jgi:hypothetical protein
MPVLARHVLCFTGAWSSFDGLAKRVREVGGPDFSVDLEFSTLRPDPRVPAAFAASVDRVRPSFDEVDTAAVREHRAVAYVLSPPMAPAAARDVSARALRLVGALLESGEATAAKGESAGIAHGKARWLELARAAEQDAVSRAHALRLAWVRRPLLAREDRVLYSCGMHLLGEPDVEVRSDLEPLDAVRWIDSFLGYLLIEKPARGLRDGETFRPSEADLRHVLRARPCGRYAADDFFYNPHGYWSLWEPWAHGDA